MARYEFGKALSEEDVLVVQGVEYRMQPVGMRAMRKALAFAESTNRQEQLDAGIDLVLSAVVPDDRDRLREHIEESVPAELIADMALMIGKGMSDLDPTQPASSSDGSSTAGSTSTDGAAPEASTPSTSLSAVP